MVRLVRAGALIIVALVLALLPAVAEAAPPTCPDGFFITAPGQRLALPADPCTDTDGDAYTLMPVSPPSHGALSTENGTTVYTPAPGYHGQDQFTYQATDANNEQSNIATVSLLVDTAPTCRDDGVTIESGTRLILNGLPCDDADGDVLDFFLSDPQHGTLEFAPDGSSATYTPAAGYVGPDEIPFDAVDPFTLASHAVLAISVVAPAPAPAPAAAPPAAPPAAPRDTIAPRISRLGARATLGEARTRGVRVSFTTSEGGRAIVALTVSRATARKLELARNPRGIVRVGSLERRVASGRSTLRVKLTARARAALRTVRTVKLRVTLAVTDPAGNRATRSTTVTLKR